MTRHRVLPADFDPTKQLARAEDAVNWAVDRTRHGLARRGVLPPRRLALRALAYHAILSNIHDGRILATIERTIRDVDALPTGYRLPKSHKEFGD